MEALSISTVDPRIQRALEDYLEMGSDARSIAALYRIYRQQVYEDPTISVPTTDLTTLATWEAQYGWKTQAIEYDSVTKQAFRSRRKRIITDLASRQLNLGDRLIELAESSIEQMLANEKVLNTQDTLAYLRMGMQIQRQAQDQLLALEDPAGEAGESSDYMTALRNMVFGQVGQVNVQINNVTPPLQPQMEELDPSGLVLLDED